MVQCHRPRRSQDEGVLNMPAIVSYASADGNLAAGIAAGLSAELDRRQRQKDELDMRKQMFEMQKQARVEEMNMQHQYAQQVQQANQAFQQQRDATDFQQRLATITQQQQMGQEAERIRFEREQAAKNSDPVNVFKLAEMKRKADQESANRSVLLSGYRGSSLPLEAGQASPEILAGFVNQGNKQADEARQQQAFMAGIQSQIDQLTGNTSLPPAMRDAQLVELRSRLAVAQAGGKTSGDPFNMPGFNPRFAALAQQDAAKAMRSPIADLLKQQHGSVLRERAAAVANAATPEEVAKFDAQLADIERRYEAAFNQPQQQVMGGTAQPAARIDPAALAQKTITLPDGTIEQVDPSIMQEAVRMARQWFIDYAQRDPDTATPDERVEKTALFYAKIREQRLADHAIAAKSRTAEVMQGAAGARAQPRKPQPQQWQPMYPPPMPIR
jgi:hypothetical protein